VQLVGDVMVDVALAIQPRARSREIDAPDGDFVLARGDELLLAGWSAARRALDTILLVDGVLEYVVTGRRMPSSWIWRKLSASGSR
jgi:hypothetical protein